MKRFLNGVQAVVVELLGILIVLGMLFGFTAMGLHSASGQPPTLGSMVSHQWGTWTQTISNHWLGSAAPDASRQRYVADRLGFFSQTYSVAARQHVQDLFDDLQQPPANSE